MISFDSAPTNDGLVTHSPDFCPPTLWHSALELQPARSWQALDWATWAAPSATLAASSSSSSLLLTQNSVPGRHRGPVPNPALISLMEQRDFVCRLDHINVQAKLRKSSHKTREEK